MSEVLAKIVGGPSSLELGLILCWFNGSNQQAFFRVSVQHDRGQKELNILPVLKSLTILNRQKELWLIKGKIRYPQYNSDLFDQQEKIPGLECDDPIEMFYWGNKRYGDLSKRLKLADEEVFKIAHMLDSPTERGVSEDIPRPLGLADYLRNQVPRHDKEDGGEYIGCDTTFYACLRWVKQNPDHALTWEQFVSALGSKK